MSRTLGAFWLAIVVLWLTAGVAFAQSAADTTAIVRAIAKVIALELRSPRYAGSPAAPVADSAMWWTHRVANEIRARDPDLLPSATPSDSTHALRFGVRSVEWTSNHLVVRITWSQCTRRVSWLNSWIHNVNYEFTRAGSDWAQPKRSLESILDGSCDPAR